MQRRKYSLEFREQAVWRAIDGPRPVETNGEYRSNLYDSFGNVVVSRLTADGDTWTYHGDTTRATVAKHDHHVQTVQQERTDDGAAWIPSMRVTLHKID